MSVYLEPHLTERLILKALTLEHVSAWENFLVNPKANKYFPLERNHRGHAKIWIERQINRYNTDGYGLLAIHLKSTNEFIGQCGLIIQPLEGAEVFEVGYHLMPSHWGNGYATEAASYMKYFAFENNLTPKLYSMIHTQNLPSQQVAERNGMTKEREINYKNLPIYLYTAEKKDNE